MTVNEDQKLNFTVGTMTDEEQQPVLDQRVPEAGPHPPPYHAKHYLLPPADIVPQQPQRDAFPMRATTTSSPLAVGGVCLARDASSLIAGPPSRPAPSTQLPPPVEKATEQLPTKPRPMMSPRHEAQARSLPPQPATQQQPSQISPTRAEGATAGVPSQEPTAQRTPPPPTAPVGGDVHDCLSADELDALVAPHIPDHYISAYQLHGVRTKKRDASAVRRHIEQVTAKHGWAMAPFHVAHHWATALFTASPAGDLATLVLDSAPSRLTRPEFIGVIESMGLPPPRVQSHARQPRGSNECGVHVVWIAAMQRNGSPRPYVPDHADSHEKPTSLASVRRLLTAAPGGVGSGIGPIVQDILRAAPPPRDVGTPGPSGGAPRRTSPETPVGPCGVANRATDCYINAACQALAHTASSFGDGELGRFLSALHHGAARGDKAVPVPEMLRRFLFDEVRHASLDDVGHQDAHEFLMHVFKSAEHLNEQFTTSEITTTERQGSASQSVKVDYTNHVSLPLAASTLEGCIAAYSHPDYVDASESEAAGKVVHTFAPARDCLALQLVRFDNDLQKDSRAVTIPESFRLGDRTFDVTAVVHHRGKTGKSGHYVATVKRQGAWFVVNDAQTSAVSSHTDAGPKFDPYLIFARAAQRARSPTKVRDDAPAVVDVDSIDDVQTASQARAATEAAAEKRRKNDRKEQRFMHETTINEYVEVLRRAETRPVVYMDTNHVAFAQQARNIAKKQGVEAPECARMLATLQAVHRRDRDTVWVACASKHFFTLLCRRGDDKCRIFDSLVKTAPAEVKATAEAVAWAMSQLTGETPRKVELAKAPEQTTNSNDCGRHALRNAWNQAAENNDPLPTRDHIVDRKPPPQRVYRPECGDALAAAQLHKMHYIVNLEKSIPVKRYEKLCETIATALEPLAVTARLKQRKPVSVNGRKNDGVVKNMNVHIYAKGADEAAIAKKIADLAPAAKIKLFAEIAEEQTEDDKPVKPPMPAEDRGTVVEFTYTVLKPGDPRRKQFVEKGVKGKNVDDLDMAVIRVDDTAGDTARCPICPKDDPAAYKPIGKKGVLASVKYHIEQDHNMCVRSLNVVPCTCKPTGHADHCGAKVHNQAAGQEVDKLRAFVPHQDATLCRKCNVWWGNRAKKLRANGHPCVPRKPNEYVEPWPLPAEPEDTGPVGVETLTPSPARAEDTDVLLKDPDFRVGEGQLRLGPLAMTPVRSLTILTEADPDLARALIRKAFARETRQHHVSILRTVGEAARELVENNDPDADGPVVPWLLKWTTSRSRQKKWQWATHNSVLSNLQSALKYMPTYVRRTPSWALHENVNWKLATRTTRIKAASERPKQALPATTDDVLSACRFAHKTKPEVAFLLAVTWVTFGRSGALLQVRREDIDLRPIGNGDYEFTITIMRGKSNRLGQDPHTVTGRLGQFSTFVVPLVLAQSDPKKFIVYAPSCRHRDVLRASMKDSLRNATGKLDLENRSLRRGSLQTLARAGASISTLLACSGHSSARSLKRYLNFGRVLTEEQTAATKLFDVMVTGSAAAQPSC